MNKKDILLFFGSNFFDHLTRLVTDIEKPQLGIKEGMERAGLLGLRE